MSPTGAQPRTVLLTPGPLTTDDRVRAAMDRDWGSRDAGFIALTAELRERLLAVAGGDGTHEAVPIQGAGTYALEAAVATLIGPEHTLLVLVNGAYGERMVEIARRLRRTVHAIRWPEARPVDPVEVARVLAADPVITHVALVHCETTTGILNPMEAIAAVVAQAGRALILDAMSAFGALPIDLRRTPIQGVLASSNKCLEGPPGLAFALVERQALHAAHGRSPSLSLDLAAQAKGFDDNGQWRFTPPVQVVAGLVEALRLLEMEGGAPARLARYQAHLDRLVDGMARLGVGLYLARADQAPIIATFRPPADRPFEFATVYARLAAAGFVIYPGKLTQAETFRIGCIGAVTLQDFDRLLVAVAEALPPAVAASAA